MTFIKIFDMSGIEHILVYPSKFYFIPRFTLFRSGTSIYADKAGSLQVTMQWSPPTDTKLFPSIQATALAPPE